MIKELLRRFEAEFIGQSKVYYPAKDTMYYGRISDKELEELQARNEKAIQKRIEEMGEKWVTHPANQVKRSNDECK